MIGSELDDLETLLYRVLPDPRGFADRVLKQLLERVGGTNSMTESQALIPGEYEDFVGSLQTRNLVLAAALGACDCWGENPDCVDCSGQGTPGWEDPDPLLFREFVSPAIKRARSRSRSIPERNKQSQTIVEGVP